MESLLVSHCLLLLLAFSYCLSGPIELLHVSPFLLQFMEMLHISNCLPWLLDFSPGSMDSLHVSNCFLSLLAFSHILSFPMELLHFSQCLSFVLAVSCCLS